MGTSKDFAAAITGRSSGSSPNPFIESTAADNGESQAFAESITGRGKPGCSDASKRFMEAVSGRSYTGDDAKGFAEEITGRSRSSSFGGVRLTESVRLNVVGLVEYASTGTKARIDKERGIIYAVKVIGHESLNGRSYTPDALRRSVGMYEGAKVNIDHPRKPGEPRSYRDRFGVLRNAKYVEGVGVVADLHFNIEHSEAKRVLYDAENAPGNLGLSHVANGRTVNRGGKVVVEDILSVASVDLVADPATTKGLFETAA